MKRRWRRVCSGTSASHKPAERSPSDRASLATPPLIQVPPSRRTSMRGRQRVRRDVRRRRRRGAERVRRTPAARARPRHTRPRRPRGFHGHHLTGSRKRAASSGHRHLCPKLEETHTRDGVHSRIPASSLLARTLRGRRPRRGWRTQCCAQAVGAAWDCRRNRRCRSPLGLRFPAGLPW